MKTKADTPINFVPGIGAARAKLLEKLGITTVRELLYHLPRGYQNRGNILRVCDSADGTVGAFMLTVGTAPRSATISGKRTITKFSAFDDSGSCTVIFFNSAYVKDIFHVGATFRFWGKLTKSGGRPALTAPVFEPCISSAPLPDLVPVYPLTAGISQKLMSSIMRAALRGRFLGAQDDIIPEHVRRRYSLPVLSEALRMVHAPESADEPAAAMRRFTFERIFLFSLCAGLSKEYIDGRSAPDMTPPELDPFLSALSFEPTGAQKRAISEIMDDMCKRKDGRAVPMNRILTGDVGSGKTVCAAAAIYIAVKNGTQATLMAPTEILAVQHYDDLRPFFEGLGITAALLTGSVGKAQRRKILAGLESGELDLVVGTHALITPDVTFRRLGLVITDEQHRFGVMQRTALAEKSGINSVGNTGAGIVADGDEKPSSSESAHILVMSATPIPRTLALILYGDLSISTLDELPPGRQKVDTFAVGESYRERIYAFIRKHVAAGNQVYIVCPAVDPADAKSDPESPEEYISAPTRSEQFPLSLFDTAAPTEQAVVPRPLKNVTETAALLSEKIFPDIPVGYVHGKMKAADKEAAMRDFSQGKTKILVSTTVIEVGVNVPNATLMIIEDADRFGLSQLHQLRGRVGRGSAKSYCILISDSRGENAKKRLETMQKTNDGYAIAQTDLELRGPGDFFPRAGAGGARQHGAVDTELLAASADPALTAAASEAAKALLEDDAYLDSPENAAALAAASRMFDTEVNTIH